MRIFETNFRRPPECELDRAIRFAQTPDPKHPGEATLIQCKYISQYNAMRRILDDNRGFENVGGAYRHSNSRRAQLACALSGSFSLIIQLNNDATPGAGLPSLWARTRRQADAGS